MKNHIKDSLAGNRREKPYPKRIKMETVANFSLSFSL